MVLDPCQHRVCKVCIHDWHYKSNSLTCPLCHLSLAADQGELLHRYDQIDNSYFQQNESLPRVEAAGGILVQTVNHTLYYLALLQQRDSGLYWVAPKGHMEVGEDSLTTARREIAEETGLRDITLIDFVCKQVYPLSEPRRFKTVFWYLFKVVQPDELLIEQAEGFVMAKWLTYEDALHTFSNHSFVQVFKIAHTMHAVVKE